MKKLKNKAEGFIICTLVAIVSVLRVVAATIGGAFITVALTSKFVDTGVLSLDCAAILMVVVAIVFASISIKNIKMSLR